MRLPQGGGGNYLLERARDRRAARQSPGLGDRRSPDDLGRAGARGEHDPGRLPAPH